MCASTRRSVTILGCGWLGLPLGAYLVAQGHSVNGTTTRPERLRALSEAGIVGHTLTLGNSPIAFPEGLLEADVVVIAIPPKASVQGEDFYPAQIEQLAAALYHSPASHVLLVSSTSVYPELSRVMVEEEVRLPEESAAPALVRAEQAVTGLQPHKRVSLLRCGGLMGYERIPGKYVKGKKDLTTGDVPVNYIHRDDAVAMIAQLIEQELPSATYNVVAPLHPTRREVYVSSCEAFGWEVPTFRTPSSPTPFKVISAQAIVHDLSYRFQYPDPLLFHYSLG